MKNLSALFIKDFKKIFLKAPLFLRPPENRADLKWNLANSLF